MLQSLRMPVPRPHSCEGTDDAEMPCVDDCYLRVAGQTVPANCERPTPGQLIRASRARKKTHPGGKDLAVLPSLVRVLFPDSHGAAQCLARPSGSSGGMPGHHRECAMKHAESSAPSAIQEVTLLFENNNGKKRLPSSACGASAQDSSAHCCRQGSQRDQAFMIR